jgi:hypothetical protein
MSAGGRGDGVRMGHGMTGKNRDTADGEVVIVNGWPVPVSAGMELDEFGHGYDSSFEFGMDCSRLAFRSRSNAAKSSKAIRVRLHHRGIWGTGMIPSRTHPKTNAMNSRKPMGMLRTHSRMVTSRW